MAEETVPLKELFSLAGTVLAVLGHGLVMFGDSYEASYRKLASAVRVADLADLEERLRNGSLQLPAVVAITSACATTQRPLKPSLHREGVNAVMLRSIDYVESIWMHKAFEPILTHRQRDAWIMAQSWNLRDGQRSICMSSRPEVSPAFSPASLQRSARHEITTSPPMAVLRMVLAMVLKQRMALALVHEEHVVPVDARVSVVGVLASVDERMPAFEPHHAHGPLRCHSDGSFAPGARTGKLLAMLGGIDLAGPKDWPQRVLVTSNIDGHQQQIRTLATAALALGHVSRLYGMWRFGRKAFKFFRQRRRLHEMRARRRQERIQRTEASAADSGDGDGDGMLECTICMARRRNAAFPCGHVVTCLACAYRCNGCPVCRRRGDPIELFHS